MTNTERMMGAHLQEDSKGRIYEPKNQCKICLGYGIYNGVNPTEYSKPNWQKAITHKGCKCVKIWLPTEEYDRLHPSIGV